MKIILKWGGLFAVIYFVVLIIATVFGDVRPVDLQWIVPLWYDLVRPWATGPFTMSGMTTVNAAIIISQAVVAFVYGCIVGGIIAGIKKKRR